MSLKLKPIILFIYLFFVCNTSVSYLASHTDLKCFICHKDRKLNYCKFFYFLLSKCSVLVIIASGVLISALNYFLWKEFIGLAVLFFLYFKTDVNAHLILCLTISENWYINFEL